LPKASANPNQDLGEAIKGHGEEQNKGSLNPLVNRRDNPMFATRFCGERWRLF
jgi:hypothetical protein